MSARFRALGGRRPRLGAVARSAWHTESRLGEVGPAPRLGPAPGVLRPPAPGAVVGPRCGRGPRQRHLRRAPRRRRRRGPRRGAARPMRRAGALRPPARARPLLAQRPALDAGRVEARCACRGRCAPAPHAELLHFRSRARARSRGAAASSTSTWPAASPCGGQQAETPTPFILGLRWDLAGSGALGGRWSGGRALGWRNAEFGVRRGVRLGRYCIARRSRSLAVALAEGCLALQARRNEADLRQLLLLLVSVFCSTVTHGHAPSS